jgi:hypothetical protein
MAARTSAWPHHAHTYRLPELLADIRLLDLLELSGSTHQASRLLQLSQPSVSRRYRALAEDFALQADTNTRQGCRYGTNATMHLLRLSCRCHRLEAGVARLGTDLVHHGLLEGLPWLLPSPLRFRPLQDWLDLVRQGVLDGALVSQLEFEHDATPSVSDVELHRLGAMPLALATAPSADVEPDRNRDVEAEVDSNRASIEVLVPTETIAAGLRNLLSGQGWSLRSVGPGCSTPEHWRAQLRRWGGAIPVGAVTLERTSRWTGDLERLRLAEGTVSPVWLALPRGSEAEPVLRHTLERLRAHPALTG